MDWSCHEFLPMDTELSCANATLVCGLYGFLLCFRTLPKFCFRLAPPTLMVFSYKSFPYSTGTCRHEENQLADVSHRSLPYLSRDGVDGLRPGMDQMQVDWTVALNRGVGSGGKIEQLEEDIPDNASRRIWRQEFGEWSETKVLPKQDVGKR